MATIGLKVASDPYTQGSLSLADTLAKGIFGDPEGQMKAKALASEVGVRMASRDKLIADTGLVNIKTREEQANADALDRAANAGPLVANAAVPMPVPVEASRANAPGTTGYGPQPGIVDAQAQRMHDAIIAQNNALWPAIVRNSNGPQLVKAGGELAGTSVLEGGLVPGSRPDPNTLRIAGGLFTGSAPTTSTVWSPGDTAGVDAAARQKIEEEAAKTVQPHDVTYRGQPGIVRLDANGNPVYTGAQGTEQNPEKPDLVDLPGGGKGALIRDPQGNPIGVKALPGAEGRPEKQDIVDLPNGGKGVAIRDGQGNVLGLIPIPGGAGPPKTESFDPKKPAMTWDGTKFVPAPGAPVAAPETGGPFAGSTATDGRALDFTSRFQTKWNDPNFIPSKDDATYFSTTYNHLYEQPKPVEYTAADGSTGIRWVTLPPPSGMPTPAQVFARANGQAAPPVQAPPVQTPPVQAPPVQAPPVATPPVATPPVATTPPVAAAPPVAPAPASGPAGSVVVQPLTGPKPTPPPTHEQDENRRYLTMAADAHDRLSKFNPKTIPNGLDIALARTGGEPGLVNSVLGGISSQGARDYAQAASAFIEAYARPATGATISPADYKNFYQAMIPLPTDNANRLAVKAKLRSDLVDVYTQGGFPDEKSRNAWLESRKKSSDGGGDSGGSGDDVPPKSYTDQGGTPAGWKKLKPDKRKLFQ